MTFRMSIIYYHFENIFFIILNNFHLLTGFQELFFKFFKFLDQSEWVLCWNVEIEKIRRLFNLSTKQRILCGFPQQLFLNIPHFFGYNILRKSIFSILKTIKISCLTASKGLMDEDKEKQYIHDLSNKTQTTDI